jgi:hypothetical protein
MERKRSQNDVIKRVETPMRTVKRSIALLFCVFFLGACALRAQEGSQNSEKSCLRFSQDFYDWYVKKTLNDLREANQLAPWHAAMRYNGNPFSRGLTRALVESDAEAKADGDPVLDFDPILNTQDPADHYVVRSTALKNGHCWAEVYGVWSRPIPPQGEKPQVVAEIVFENGRWHFVNFHYPNSTNPDNENLLSLLRYRYHPK